MARESDYEEEDEAAACQVHPFQLETVVRLNDHSCLVHEKDETSLLHVQCSLYGFDTFIGYYANNKNSRTLLTCKHSFILFYVSK